MKLFYVFQGDTYKKELAGGYVWSPQKTKNNQNHIGYKNMMLIKKGDLILHHSKGKIRALSIAENNCESSPLPQEIEDYSDRWDTNGFRVNTKYYEFKNPITVNAFQGWLHSNHEKNSAFNINGKPLQGYMYYLSDLHANFFIQQILLSNQSEFINNKLLALQKKLSAEVEVDYEENELLKIEQIIENDKKRKTKANWSGEPEKQKFTKGYSGNPKPKRSPRKAANALEIANFICEVDINHKLFLRKNGINYTEPHHLIPISKYKDFKPFNLDMEENIVSLCSHCHNLLHYGRFEDKKEILSKLFNQRNQALKSVSLDLSLEELESYYK